MMRFETHYMYGMSARIEVPITTLSDGTATLVVVPNSIMGIAVLSGNYKVLPFVSLATSTGNFLWTNTPTTYNAPFASQFVNSSTFAWDHVSVDFANT